MDRARTNKSSKDNGPGEGVGENSGYTLQPDASSASIPACMTGMQAAVSPLTAAYTKDPGSTLQGLEGSSGTSQQNPEEDLSCLSPPTRSPHRGFTLSVETL